MTLYNYVCTILNWVDGDTVDVLIDLGFRITQQQRIRVYGINAPEMTGSTKQQGIAARTMAMWLCNPGIACLIRTAKPGSNDRYGRWLATITMPDGKDFAAEMIAKGHAAAYMMGMDDASVE
jgi:micrococcal nuclease